MNFGNYIHTTSSKFYICSDICIFRSDNVVIRY